MLSATKALSQGDIPEGNCTPALSTLSNDRGNLEIQPFWWPQSLTARQARGYSCRIHIPHLENTPHTHIMAVQYMLFKKKISCKVARVPSMSGILSLKNKSHYGWTQPSPKKKRRPIEETWLSLILPLPNSVPEAPTPTHSTCHKAQAGMRPGACQVKQ